MKHEQGSRKRTNITKNLAKINQSWVNVDRLYCLRLKVIIYIVVNILSCQPGVTVTSRFVYKAIRDLESIDHLFINPIRRIGLIHKCSLDSRWLKWIVQVNVLLNNCKQTISSLSLLVGTTVVETA